MLNVICLLLFLARRCPAGGPHGLTWGNVSRAYIIYIDHSLFESVALRGTWTIDHESCTDLIIVHMLLFFFRQKGDEASASYCPKALCTKAPST